MLLTWFAYAGCGIVGEEREEKKQKDKIAKKENDAVEVNDRRPYPRQQQFALRCRGPAIVGGDMRRAG